MATDITRDDVLSVARGLRAENPSGAAEAAIDTAVRNILRGLVSADTAAGDVLDYTAYPTPGGGPVDGVLIDATVHRYVSGATQSNTVVAVAAVEAEARLGGSVTISGSGAVLRRAALTGTVVVTDPIDTAGAGVLEVAVTGALTGVPDGEPTTPDPDPTPTPDPDPTPAPEPTPTDEPAPMPTPTPRTAAEKAAARKAYDKALKDAKKKYAAARKKAGRSQRKKVAAKKKYSQRKAAAKARYRAAIADLPAQASTRTAGTTAAAAGATAVGATFSLTISTDVGWALTA